MGDYVIPPQSQYIHSVACSWSIMFLPCSVVRPDVRPVPTSARRASRAGRRPATMAGPPCGRVPSWAHPAGEQILYSDATAVLRGHQMTMYGRSSTL